MRLRSRDLTMQLFAGHDDEGKPPCPPGTHDDRPHSRNCQCNPTTKCPSPGPPGSPKGASSLGVLRQQLREALGEAC